MDRATTYLTARLAETDEDRMASARLRYEVFVDELGGDGTLVDHDRRLEQDRFDPYYDHLVLVDTRRDPADLNHVVGVYRLLDDEGADRAGQFYSEDEYDLSVLKESGRRLLELGRSCLHREFRGGVALHRMWQALAAYVDENDIEVLFGVASFHGADVEAHAEALSLLHASHLAPEPMRVRARDEHFQAMNLVPVDQIDRVAAMRQVPQLIKSYLRLGGLVGDGAFVDGPFNTVDVCLILDTARMNDAVASRYRTPAP